MKPCDFGHGVFLCAPSMGALLEVQVLPRAGNKKRTPTLITIIWFKFDSASQEKDTHFNYYHLV